jgi:hypothetical protein
VTVAVAGGGVTVAVTGGGVSVAVTGGGGGGGRQSMIGSGVVVDDNVLCTAGFDDLGAPAAVWWIVGAANTANSPRGRFDVDAADEDAVAVAVATP